MWPHVSSEYPLLSEDCALPVSNGLGQGRPRGLGRPTEITPENDSSQGQLDEGYQAQRSDGALLSDAAKGRDGVPC